MKKLFAVSLAVMMAAALCACGSTSSSETTTAAAGGETTTAAAGETTTAEETTTVSNTDKKAAEFNPDHEYTSVICSLSSDAKTLCPYASDGGGREYTRATCFEPLTYTNAQGEWEMVLAKSVTNDGPVYTVEIYDYIKDQAGNPITASDVVFSYDKFIEEGSNKAKVAHLESYEATDDYTIVFTFDDELKGCAQELFDKCMIVSEKSYTESPDEMVTTPVGTAPYALTDMESGSYYVYEYTGDYWQTDESLISTRSYYNVDKITYRVITDKSTDAISLEKGETDCSGGLNYADYATFCDPNTFTANDGYNLDVITNNALYNLVFNCGENSPCADVNLRKAICYAIDADAASYLGFGENQYKTAIGYTNPVWMDYTDKIDDGDYYNYSEDLAKEYLAKSNYNGESIKILVCQNTSARTMATAIQAYLTAVGINCELLEYDSSIYNEDKRDETGTVWDIDFNNERANYYAWGGTVGCFSNSYLSNGLNHCYINDDKLQELYDTICLESSTEDDMVEFLEYIEDNCYGYALTTYFQPCFTNDRFTNIVRVPQGNFILGACSVTAD